MSPANASNVPSRRRLLVHVGTPKTGSTTIQRTLAALEEELRRRGVHVPHAGRRGNTAFHHALHRPAATRASGAWQQLIAEVHRSDARQFVVSDEGLSRNPCPVAARAAARVAVACDLDLDVVGYVRPQSQYFESRYAQMVKNGYETRPFDLFASESLAPRSTWRRRLDYRQLFAPWREVFGDRVAVFPLEPSRLPDGLVVHFLGQLGAADLARAKVPHANVRPGAKEVEVRRLTAEALSRRGFNRRESVMKRLTSLPQLLQPDAPFAGLGRAQAQRLMELFDASNVAFAREYGIDCGGQLFRDPTVDSCARPNVAQWHDLDLDQQRAVRDYVLCTAGVDPTPRRDGRGWIPQGALPATLERLARAARGLRRISRGVAERHGNRLR